MYYRIYNIYYDIYIHVLLYKLNQSLPWVKQDVTKWFRFPHTYLLQCFKHWKVKATVMAAVGCEKLVCLNLVPGTGLLYLAYSADVWKYCIKHQVQHKGHVLDIAKVDVERDAQNILKKLYMSISGNKGLWIIFWHGTNMVLVNSEAEQGSLLQPMLL